MKNFLNKFGSGLALFGIGSMILNLVGYEFILFMWLGFFPPIIAWFIRISMVVLGGAMFVASKILKD